MEEDIEEDTAVVAEILEEAMLEEAILEEVHIVRLTLSKKHIRNLKRKSVVELIWQKKQQQPQLTMSLHFLNIVKDKLFNAHREFKSLTIH